MSTVKIVDTNARYGWPGSASSTQGAWLLQAGDKTFLAIHDEGGQVSYGEIEHLDGSTTAVPHVHPPTTWVYEVVGVANGVHHAHAGPPVAGGPKLSLEGAVADLEAKLAAAR